MVQLNIRYPNLGNVLRAGAAIKGQEARNALMQQQIESYPEERNWLQKGRQRLETQWSQQDEDRQRRIKEEERKRIREMSNNDRTNAIFRIQTMSKWLKNIEDVKDYAGFKDWLDKQNMMDTSRLPDPNDFMGAGGVPDEASFDQWRNQQIALGVQKVEEIKPTYDMQTIYGPKGQTKRVSVKKGESYTPPKGWTLRKPSEKGKQLTPAQKSQKEAYMKEYGNNLAIIKAYKTGYDPMGFGMKVTEDDYNQAVDRNKELDKWFKELGINKGSRKDLLNQAIKIAQDMQKNPKSEKKKVSTNTKDPLGIRK